MNYDDLYYGNFNVNEVSEIKQTPDYSIAIFQYNYCLVERRYEKDPTGLENWRNYLRHNGRLEELLDVLNSDDYRQHNFGEPERRAIIIISDVVQRRRDAMKAYHKRLEQQELEKKQRELEKLEKKQQKEGEKRKKAELKAQRRLEMQHKNQAKYQSIWLQLQQFYGIDTLNESLQICYPEHYKLILRNQEVDFLKTIFKGRRIDFFKNLLKAQDINQVQDFSFFFADKIHIPYNERKRHSFIVASSGSGKSELIKYLIWQDFKHSNTALILIDPQGDLADQVAKLKGKNNDKLVYFNLNLEKDKTPIFNPLYLPKASSEEAERHAMETIAILEELVGEDLTAPMRRLAFPLIYMLIMQGNKSLSDLIDYLADDKKEKVVEMSKRLPNSEVRKFFSEYFTNKQFDSTKVSISSKVGELLYESKFRDATTGVNTIDLEKYVNEGYKVIFNLSGLSDKATDIFGKLITTQIRILANKREHSTHRPSVFVYIDEFQRIRA